MAEQAHAAEEHAQSIFYGPVNRLWDTLAGWIGVEDRFGPTDVPEHVVMSLVVLAAVCLLVIPLRARLRPNDPGWFQQFAELVVPSLQAALKKPPSLEAAQRIEKLLDAIASQPLPPEKLRDLRAVSRPFRRPQGGFTEVGLRVQSLAQAFRPSHQFQGSSFFNLRRQRTNFAARDARPIETTFR